MWNRIFVPQMGKERLTGEKARRLKDSQAKSQFQTTSNDFKPHQTKRANRLTSVCTGAIHCVSETAQPKKPSLRLTLRGALNSETAKLRNQETIKNLETASAIQTAYFDKLSNRQPSNAAGIETTSETA